MRSTPILLIPLLAACPPQEGWVPAEDTGGPVVRYDIDAEPLPEIPLPNDAATRLDPASPTGRRLNFSELADTQHERETRQKFNRLDGFGAYAPLFVSFDAPLDLEAVERRHRFNDDFRDDAVFLLNVDPDCSRYGEEIALDFGRGRFPGTLWKHSRTEPDPAAPEGLRLLDDNLFFPFDAHGTSANLLFEERNEDRDGDGELDPGEDTDHDGVLDEANFIDPFACDDLPAGSPEHDRCLADHLLTWYERQTDTLVLRPLWPMEQRCTHAVLLTKRLLGADGNPVQSPFPAVHHRDQEQALRHAEPLLARYGLVPRDVAFAWTFTVGSMTGDLEALRAGLYGAGPFARLAEEFPVTGFTPWTRADLAALAGEEPTEGLEDERLLPGACVGSALSWLWGPGLSEWGPNLCSIEADLSSVGGLFGGTFTAPNLLADQDGQATEAYPADNDEVWDLDAAAGEAHYGSTDVTFWCALPREIGEGCAEGNPDGRPFCRPFPVIFYAHGYGGSRGEITLHMGRHAAMGYAMCGLDSYGHGLNRWFVDPEAGSALTLATGAFTADGVRELGPLMIAGRDRDLNNDGLPDSGMDMWTSDVFHTRDMIRQSVLEEMQFVRMLRSFDGRTTDAAGRLLGDIDDDGRVDLGGPTNTVGMWGISLGGILSGVAAGAEPGLDAVSPNAGGAGLTDITARSSQAGVPEAVVLPMLGPILAGCLPVDGDQQPVAAGEEGRDCLDGDGRDGPYPGGLLRVAQFAQDQAGFRLREVGRIEGVQVGDRVEVENLRSGEVKSATVGPRGWFRLGVAADALDAVERRSLIGLTGDAPGPGVSRDNAALGDPLALRVFVGSGRELRGAVDTFGWETEFQGTIYRAGSPLVALQRGYGYQRNSPDFRRFVGFAQHGIASADPAVWTAHAFLQPLDVPYDPHVDGGNTRVLVMPTIGDANVPVSTGVAMGRTAGVLGSWLRDEATYGPEVGWRELFARDPRYGTSPDQWLVDTHVVEGVPRLQRWADNPINPNALFDPENLSDGAATFSCGDSDWSAIIGENACPEELEGQEVFFPVPTPEPGDELRRTRERLDGTHDAFLVPLLRPAGQHGIYNSQSFRTFDADAYAVDWTVRFLGTRGAAVDHPSGCDCSASRLPNFTRDGEARTPSRGFACSEVDLKVCSPACAAAWGIVTPDEAACSTP